MRWLVASLVFLVACADEKPRFLPDGYRDQTVTISSSTRFDREAFAGEWRVIESFDQMPAAVTVARLSFMPSEEGYLMRQGLASGGATRQERLSIGAFGRLIPTERGRDPIWVLWVDEDHRTAVLGNPSGRIGRIINRGKTLRADRLQAARDVLAFNGYDLSKLRKVRP